MRTRQLMGAAASTLRGTLQQVRRAPERARARNLDNQAETYFAARPDRKAVLDGVRRTISTGMSVCQYHLLHQRVIERRPRVIFEFGGGASTAIMAQALSEVEAGRVVSFENMPKYSDEARALVPPYLQPFCRFELRDKHASTIQWGGRSLWGFHYATLSEEKPDMILVDGPFEAWTLDAPRGVCLDVLLYMAKADHTTNVDVIVEGKRSTVAALNSLLARRRLTNHWGVDMHSIDGLTRGDLPKGPPLLVSRTGTSKPE